PYSTWWNDGLRSTTGFHNMIGLLTESIGNPTPVEIPFMPNKLLPRADQAYPTGPQKWHFRQSIDYSMTANRAVLDVASKHREDFLFNIYRMGKNSIERGSHDNWTIHPKVLAEVQAAIAKDAPPQSDRAVRPSIDAAGDAGDTGGQAARRGVSMKYYEILRNPVNRDPRAYVIPSDQPDFLTATKFVNTLIKNGITI